MSNPGRDSSNNLTSTIPQQPAAFHVQDSHASQQQPNQNSHLVVRRLIITLVLLFVLISVVTWIVWLTIHPLRPIFTVKSFTVSNFSLSTNNPTISKGDYLVEFSIRNPNKRVSLVIDHFVIHLLYKTNLITEERMRVVYFNKMSQQSLEFSKDSEDRPFHRKDYKDIMNDWESRREVSFIVKMSIRARFRSGKWLTKTIPMKVLCKDLVVEFFGRNKYVGKLKDRGKDCKVGYD